MAAIDLDDIWDIPADLASANRVSEPLFLDSGSDNEQPTRKQQPTSSARPDVDALFENLDDPEEGFQDLAPALDLEALRREADARNARDAQAAFALNLDGTQGAGASQQKGKGARKGGKDVLVDDNDEGRDDKPARKKRKPLPKLDEARLLGKDGFPQLIQDTKYFTPKGKGHEAADLDRVLQIYQFWTHKMYPKTKFRDTVERIEKLCHSKRMHVALSVWRDEAKGLIHGQSFPNAEDEVVDLTANETKSAASDDNSDGAQPAKKRNEVVIDLDSDADEPAPRGPAPPAPSSPVSGVDDDFDLDALLAEEEALMNTAQATRTSASASTSKPAASGHGGFTDQDEAMWDEMDLEYEDVPASKPAAPKAPAHHMDDDEDMWDVVREMEQEQGRAAVGAGSAAPTSAPVPAGSSSTGDTGAPPQEIRKETDEEDWDDMYL